MAAAVNETTLEIGLSGLVEVQPDNGWINGSVSSISPGVTDNSASKVVNVLSAIKLLRNPCVNSIWTEIVNAGKVDPLLWCGWSCCISVGGGVRCSVDKGPLRREEQLLAKTWCNIVIVQTNVPSENEVRAHLEKTEGDVSSVASS